MGKKLTHEAFLFCGGLPMSALKSIRQFCLWCGNGQPKEVRLCPAEECPLWLYRHGTMPKILRRSPIKALRKKCVDCVGGQWKEVQDCTSNCPLNPYRFGKRPSKDASGGIMATRPRRHLRKERTSEGSDLTRVNGDKR